MMQFQRLMYLICLEAEATPDGNWKRDTFTFGLSRILFCSDGSCYYCRVARKDSQMVGGEGSELGTRLLLVVRDFSVGADIETKRFLRRICLVYD